MFTDEMKHIWTWMVFSICLYGIFAVITLLINDFYWITVLGNSVALIAFFGVAIIPTYWVLKTAGLNDRDVKNMNKQRQIQILHALKNSYESKDCHEKNKSFNDDLTFLRDILSEYHGYCAFMAYLGKEFATECLLSFTEFIQFKNYLLQTFPFLANKIRSKIKHEQLQINSKIPVRLCFFFLFSC